ncbi:MAG TPA: NBR1-Ig-like domain-containing protein [Anaerolineales bacterium]|nr:NBR1-Ig-like domain-containing protein [Anaerolineales bacterium]
MIESLAPTATLPPTLTEQPTSFPTRVPTSIVRPTPSRIPLPTSDTAWTPFPTFGIGSPAPAPRATAAGALACRLDWQSPGNGLEVSPDEPFTAGWHVTNIGTEVWSPGSVEFAYLSGAKPNRDMVIPLKFAVSPGQSVILTAEMKAPRNSTTYTSFWGLRQGNSYFCRVSVSIYVK